MTDLVERLRASVTEGLEPNDEDTMEAADEIERLRALKTPASRQLLNITKGCLDNAEDEVEELRAAIKYAKQASGNVLYMPIEFAEKAADEIERLRKERSYMAGAFNQQANEIERLEALVVAADREIKASHADADRLRHIMKTGKMPPDDMK